MRNAALTIRRGRRTTVLGVVIAETDVERQQGLSFRSAVPRSMVFPHFGEMEAIYRFDNMLVPVDIAVADRDGIVRDVRYNVMPQSPPIRFHGYPLGMVIEMPAGTAARHDLAPVARIIDMF